jgi:hypothetical protein
MEAHFLSFVNKTDTCWLWTGYKANNGYGHVRIGKKIVSSHRVAYNMWNGSIPNGLLIRHLCRNRECVNPKHLVIGTHSDNNGIDRIRDKSYRHKLDEDDIRNIRILSGFAFTHKELAKEYGISKEMIGQIIRKTAYASIT